jgi:hypothetical protein
VQLDRALDEEAFGFRMIRIGQAAFDWANRLTSLVIVKADAFGAKIRVDDVDIVSLADCVVGAFGFACPAVDAIGGDVRGHQACSP